MTRKQSPETDSEESETSDGETMTDADRNSSEHDEHEGDTPCVPNEFIEIQSPYRPYPLGAKKDLANQVETVIYPDDDPRTAYVSSRPDEETLDEWELTVIRTDSPEEIWETKSGDRIEIYTDRVEQDGREIPIDPEEAMEKAREQSYFTRIDTTTSDTDDTVTDP